MTNQLFKQFVSKIKKCNFITKEFATEPPTSIESLITGLTKLTSNKNQLFFHSETKSFINSYTSTDWKRFAFWEPNAYTRNLIHYDPNDKFMIYMFCWSPNVISPVHNHPDSKCFFKMLQGELVETVFEPEFRNNDFEDLKFKEEIVWKHGMDTRYIDDGFGVHKVENKSEVEGAVTFHFYAPAYKTVDLWEANGFRKMVEISDYSTFGVKNIRKEGGF